MKQILLFAALGVLLVVQACQSEEPQAPTIVPINTEEPNKETPAPAPTPEQVKDEPDMSLFAQVDANAKQLSDNSSIAVADLLAHADARVGSSPQSLHMSETEWREVLQFTEELEGLSLNDPKDKQYLTILQWVGKSIGYVWDASQAQTSDNTAYATFKTRKAVCQGYSNLLKAMCNALEIPVLVVNGGLYDYSQGTRYIGHHAWCYVYAGGAWYVADPTNGNTGLKSFKASNVESYERSLRIEGFEEHLLEDTQFQYSYDDKHLTVVGVKESSATHVVVPYAVAGYVITNFNPERYSKAAKFIYLGDNIRSLGKEGKRPQHKSNRVSQRIVISPTNQYLEDYKGSIYERKAQTQELVPIYVPAQAKKIYLKGEKTVGKNRLHAHASVEEVVFGQGVESVGGYAVENCPNLKTVYLPNTAKTIAADAFAGSKHRVRVVHYTPGEEL